MGRGFQTVHDILEVSGVGKQFQDAYGDLDPMDLVEVGMTLEPFKTRKLLKKYMGIKAGRRAPDPPPAPGNAQPAGVPRPGKLDQGRPRPMGRRGHVESPAPNLAKYASMSHEEILGLSDEEFKEMETLALQE
jgi:hypothetical protein